MSVEKPQEFDLPVLSAQDLYLFNEGSHVRLYEKLGSRAGSREGVAGTRFAVWAPNAQAVFVMGSFNGWRKTQHPLEPRGDSGVWEGFLPGIGQGSVYKYHVVSGHLGYRVDKADPFAFRAENPPATGSIVWDLAYEWSDSEWMRERRARNSFGAPISVYEMHLGSWRRDWTKGGRFLTYREIAEELPEYLVRMGFTHVEFLPVMEHPFYGSWGYQTTGFFAPTSRYGTPQDFMSLVDVLHRRGIGVLLDWVPSHFPTDEHGLAYFDGTHLYEHADPRQGFHPDWGSFIFNYGRPEVRSFLLSSALYWLDRYHVDGIRVDAVASMLYLDYSRKTGEWVPNAFGGRENLEAIAFLRRFNEEVSRAHPDALIIAEESTSWPMVSQPAYVGGLGFHFKWDMGWMHDTLEYFAFDPVYRKYHHDRLTFRMIYAFSENFLLPLSHDEVVHGKGSLIGKMPGDEWQRFANLRLLLALLFGQPGKKLLFMGGEIAQWREWNHDGSLDWDLLGHGPHRGIQRLVRELNRVYRSEPACHEQDESPLGFEWIDCHDADHSVISFLRRGRGPEAILAVFNFTPVPRDAYAVGTPFGGIWREIVNTDALEFGGTGVGNLGSVEAAPVPRHGRPFRLDLTLPPLAAVFLRGDPPPPERAAGAAAETSPEPGPRSSEGKAPGGSRRWERTDPTT